MTGPPDRRRLPVVTMFVLGITAAITSLQFLFPAALPALARTPGVLQDHEYWRFLTPLFVHAGGWSQIAFNFTAIAVVGTLVERIYGRRWLVLYFTAGLVGELAGIAWQPYGAGASVAGAGLLGGLSTWLLQPGRPFQARGGGTTILLGALCLTVLRDIHGPPLLTGICLAWAMLRRAAHPAAPGPVASGLP